MPIWAPSKHYPNPILNLSEPYLNLFSDLSELYLFSKKLTFHLHTIVNLCESIWKPDLIPIWNISDAYLNLKKPSSEPYLKPNWILTEP